MNWHNPRVSWSELERQMSGRPENRRPPSLVNDEDDSAPGFSRKRPAYTPAAVDDRPDEPFVPYAELHCHSDFSFLDGASDPETLIEEAVRLNLIGLGITDHDGFYAASRFAEAALAYDLKTIYGAELSLGLTTPQNCIADP
jgi:error-prone DNA polymerase